MSAVGVRREQATTPDPVWQCRVEGTITGSENHRFGPQLNGTFRCIVYAPSGNQPCYQAPALQLQEHIHKRLADKFRVTGAPYDFSFEIGSMLIGRNYQFIARGSDSSCGHDPLA
jgi:hypothetical protein